MQNRFKVEAYSHEKHYEMLCAWLSKYEMGNPIKGRMFETGLVVSYTSGNTPLAAGFIMKTDSKYCMIENIASDKEQREAMCAALSYLLAQLDALARRMGYEVVAILSNLESMDLRLLDLGFKHHGKYNLFYKEGDSPCHG